MPRRDAVDERIFDQLKSGKGRIIDSQTQVGGYPEYKSAEPYKSSADDGIADEWKVKHGLNPKDSCANQIAEDGYTYLEHFLNGTEPKKKR